MFRFIFLSLGLVAACILVHAALQHNSILCKLIIIFSKLLTGNHCIVFDKKKEKAENLV